MMSKQEEIIKQLLEMARRVKKHKHKYLIAIAYNTKTWDIAINLHGTEREVALALGLGLKKIIDNLAEALKTTPEAILKFLWNIYARMRRRKRTSIF